MPGYPSMIQENNPLLRKMVNLKAGVGISGEKKNKKIEDPTMNNEAKKLVDAQMEIYKARADAKKTVNATKGIKYDDLFIEAEAAIIKFVESPLLSVCRDKLALEGENIMLTPPNMPVPSTGVKEWKNTLLSDGGIIYQDQMMHIEYKSDFQGPAVKIALQFVTRSGPITIRRANIEKSEG